MMTGTQCRGQSTRYKPRLRQLEQFPTWSPLSRSMKTTDLFLFFIWHTPSDPLRSHSAFLLRLHHVLSAGSDLADFASLKQVCLFTVGWCLRKKKFKDLGQKKIYFHSEQDIQQDIICPFSLRPGQMKNIRLKRCLLGAQWRASLTNLSIAGDRGFVSSCVISGGMAICSPVYPPLALTFPSCANRHKCKKKNKTKNKSMAVHRFECQGLIVFFSPLAEWCWEEGKKESRVVKAPLPQVILESPHPLLSLLFFLDMV